MRGKTPKGRQTPEQKNINLPLIVSVEKRRQFLIGIRGMGQRCRLLLEQILFVLERVM